MGRVWACALLTSAALVGCDLYDNSDDDCPCPAGYQCCEGRGYCVAVGASCDLAPERNPGRVPSPPPAGSPDAGAPEPSPVPSNSPISTGTCCEDECSPVTCSAWDFPTVGFASTAEAREALTASWTGFRHVPWDQGDKPVELSFAEDSYVSDCVPAWCAGAFYWGYDGKDEALDYQLWASTPDGVEGQLTVYLGGEAVGLPLYDTGTAHFQLDVSRNRMRIAFTRDWGQSAPSAPAWVYLQKVAD